MNGAKYKRHSPERTAGVAASPRSHPRSDQWSMTTHLEIAEVRKTLYVATLFFSLPYRRSAEAAAAVNNGAQHKATRNAPTSNVRRVHDQQAVRARNHRDGPFGSGGKTFNKTTTSSSTFRNALLTVPVTDTIYVLTQARPLCTKDHVL